jgi:hypothetical protein
LEANKEGFREMKEGIREKMKEGIREIKDMLHMLD